MNPPVKVIYKKKRSSETIAASLLSSTVAVVCEKLTILYSLSCIN